MCVSCGCNQPNADYGNPGHITGTELQAAAAAASAAKGKPVSLRQIAKNITAWAKTQPK